MKATRMKSGKIPRRPPRRFSVSEDKREYIPDVQREYILKDEGEILTAVLRGHDIEYELLDAIRVLYEVDIVYMNRCWFVIDIREETYGTAIQNPATGNASFPHLTSVLKWCKDNRFS